MPLHKILMSAHEELHILLKKQTDIIVDTRARTSHTYVALKQVGFKNISTYFG